MAGNRRIVVTGATGLIGKKLCARLQARGDQVVVFSRNPHKARQVVPGAAEYIAWSTRDSHGDWVGALAGAQAIINLAGASIFGRRWDDSYKDTLRSSRIQTTRMLVDAIAQLDNKPAVLLSGSAVGYYGFRDDTPLDEDAAPGDDFLGQLCAEWEAEARKAEAHGLRVVTLRTGIVLDADEGALPLMKMPFLFFGGGPILPGTQWFSWVHVEDEVNLILWALDTTDVHGPLNLAAPQPERNKDFMATLGKTIGTPSWLPVPGFALQVALGEFADSLTHGQRAIPQKAQDLGYQFRYPAADQALQHLLKQKS